MAMARLQRAYLTTVRFPNAHKVRSAMTPRKMLVNSKWVPTGWFIGLGLSGRKN